MHPRRASSGGTTLELLEHAAASNAHNGDFWIIGTHLTAHKQ